MIFVSVKIMRNIINNDTIEFFSCFFLFICTRIASLFREVLDEKSELRLELSQTLHSVKMKEQFTEERMYAMQTDVSHSYTL